MSSRPTLTTQVHVGLGCSVNLCFYCLKLSVCCLGWRGEVHVPWCPCGSGEHLFPSTLWILGLKLRQSGLLTSAFTCEPFLCPPSEILSKHTHTTLHRGQQDSSVSKGSSAKSDNLNSIPVTNTMKGTSSHKLSSHVPTRKCNYIF